MMLGDSDDREEHYHSPPDVCSGNVRFSAPSSIDRRHSSSSIAGPTSNSTTAGHIELSYPIFGVSDPSNVGNHAWGNQRAEDVTQDRSHMVSVTRSLSEPKTLAVKMGDEGMLSKVLAALREESPGKKALEQLMSSDGEGVTVLMKEARAGNATLFSAVLRGLCDFLPSLQFQAELAARGDDGSTLLISAVKGGSPGVFEAVVASMRKQAVAQQEYLAAQGIPTLVHDGQTRTAAEEVHIGEQGLLATVPAREESSGTVCIYPHPASAICPVLEPVPAARRSATTTRSNPVCRGGGRRAPSAGNYFEVTLVSCGGGDGSVCVGFADPENLPPPGDTPGLVQGSYAYHGDSGGLYGGGRFWRAEREWSPWKCGDVIGCGFDVNRSAIWLTINGQLMGDGFVNVKEARLVPVVGFRSSNHNKQKGMATLFRPTGLDGSPLLTSRSRRRGRGFVGSEDGGVNTGVSMQVRVNFGMSPFLYKGREVVIAQVIEEERLSMNSLAQTRQIDPVILTADLASEVKAKDNEGMTVLMHAARCVSDPRMFSVVLGTLKETLPGIQVAAELVRKSNCEDSVLMHATKAGGDGGDDGDVVKVVKKALVDAGEGLMGRLCLRGESGRGDVKDDCGDGEGYVSLVDTWLWRLKDVEEFALALGVMCKLLPLEKVREQVTATDGFMSTPLVHVSRVGGLLSALPGVLDVLAEEILTPVQVKEQLLAKAADGFTLLMMAVGTSSPEVFVHVFNMIKDRFTKDEVIEQLEQFATNSEGGQNVLMLAAGSGNDEVFTMVLNVLEGVFSRDRILTEHFARDNDGVSLLGHATISGNFNIITAVWTTLRTDLQSIEVLEQVISAKDARGRTLLMYAIGLGSPEVFVFVREALQDVLRYDQLVEQVMASDDEGCTVLMHSINRRKLDMFPTVLTFLRDVLQRTEVWECLVVKDNNGWNLQMITANHCSQDMFCAVVGALRGTLSSKEFAVELMATYVDNTTTLMEIASRRDTTKETMGMFVNDLQALGSKGIISSEQMVRLLHVRNKSDDQNSIMLAAQYGMVESCLVLVEFAALSGCDLDAKSAGHVSKRKSATYMALDRTDGADLDIIAALVQHGAVPTSQVIITLIRKAHDIGSFSEDRLVHSLLGAVSSARNPLIPGVNLSKALGDAGLRGPETRTVVLRLREVVDDLLLRELERLPPTVRSIAGTNSEIEKGRQKVASILEPERRGGRHKYFTGPLRTAVDGRQLYFCSNSLVLDYLTLKFGCGVPGFLDVWSTPDDQEKEFLQAQGLFLSDDWFGEEVQGRGDDAADDESLTIYPGMQFILAGVAANSVSFYNVPASRMTFEFVMSVAMLILFSSDAVLIDDKKIGPGEAIFFLYVLGSIMSELEEARQGYLRSYFDNNWNKMDILLLLLLSMALIFRVASSATYEDEESLNGDWSISFLSQFFIAMSGPIFFSRLLFFARIFPSQGPMVQVIFSMLHLLVNFSVLMVIVMVGFAAAFLALFRSNTEMGSYNSWDNALLTLFKAMLGEFNIDELSPDEVNGEGGIPHGEVAVFLMVIYLTVMAIILLNLLIAVLSTAHSKVEDRAEKEFWVSRAALTLYYAREVENHALPAPFNLFQEAVCLVFMSYSWWRVNSRDSFLRRDHIWEIRHRVRKVVGKIIFWLVLGPLAVVGAGLLWAVSIPKVLFEVVRIWTTENPRFRDMFVKKVQFSLSSLLFCFGGAFFYLAMKWFCCIFRSDKLGIFGIINREKAKVRNKKSSGLSYDDYDSEFFQDSTTKRLKPKGLRHQPSDVSAITEEDEWAALTHSLEKDIDEKTLGVETRLTDRMIAMESDLRESMRVIHRDVQAALNRMASS